MLGNVFMREVGLTRRRMLITKVLEHLQERLFSRAGILSYILGDFFLHLHTTPLCCFLSTLTATRGLFGS